MELARASESYFIQMEISTSDNTMVLSVKVMER